MNGTIRLARPDDAAAILEIYHPIVRESPVTFEVEPPDEEVMARRIRQTLEYAPWLVWERDGRIHGYAHASHFRDRAAYDWTVEGSVYVAPEWRHTGVGRALFGELVDILRRQGYRNVLGIVALPNAPSVALLESLGFRWVGMLRGVGYKLGRWWDVGLWQLPLAEEKDHPSPPKTLVEVGRGPEWEVER